MDDQALMPNQGERDGFAGLYALALRLLRWPGKWERPWAEESILLEQLPPDLDGVLPFPTDMRLLGSMVRKTNFVSTSGSGSAHTALIAYDIPKPAPELATLYDEWMRAHGWQSHTTHSGPMIVLNPVEDAWRLAYYGLYYERLGAGSEIFGRLWLSFHTSAAGTTSVFVDLFRSIRDAPTGSLDVSQDALPDATEEPSNEWQTQPAGQSALIDMKDTFQRFFMPGRDFNVLKLPELLPPPHMRQQGGGGESIGGQYTSSKYTVEILEGALDLATLFVHYAEQLRQAGWRLQEQRAEGPLAESSWLAPRGERGTWRATLRMVPLPGSRPRCHLTLRAHL
jgi:hypothetical protein